MSIEKSQEKLASDWSDRLFDKVKRMEGALREISQINPDKIDGFERLILLTAIKIAKDALAKSGGM